jgi:hypothetical protein
MKFSAFRRALACLAAALFLGGAWVFHITETTNDLADNDCQLCAVASSPELNSDCGTVLLVRPENFIFIEPASPELPVKIGVVAGFYSRAPPVA